MVHGARISGLETRMSIVEDRICDIDACGSEEADNLANDRDLDRFIVTGKDFYLFGSMIFEITPGICIISFVSYFP